MFQVPAAVVSAGLIGRRGNAVECRESDLTGRASDRYLRGVPDTCIPRDPYMFYVAFGHVTTPFLHLQAFNLFVTLGPLLHHEKDFSFFRARTIIHAGELWYAPFITLLIPHHLDFPIHFLPALRKLYQYTDRAELSDVNLPNVEIIPKNHRAWRRTAVEMGPITEIQAAMASRLQESWGRSLLKTKEVI
ncbi:hypothetical protein FIBSPDRAFT_886287 [Athelia psychrophila]|uniref:Uncharacterized protein n=1 Tax=Athelia psychrophila TaxID=1759441 RepID=A0A166QZB9_9AGAM|nr:hypothetical protein FIBSPDRAFT_886287 [Fibularhizoctonia sp. CBS 109695]